MTEQYFKEEEVKAEFNALKQLQEKIIKENFMRLYSETKSLIQNSPILKEALKDKVPIPGNIPIPNNVKINSENNYFEELERIYIQTKRSRNKIKVKPLTDDLLNEYKDKFKTLTSKYINDLILLLNYSQMSFQKSNDKKLYMPEISELNNEIYKQISNVNKSNLYGKKALINVFCKLIKATQKETEIINLIADNYEYKEIYENKLIISRATFDDHLKRISQKFYTFDENEKEMFPLFKQFMPNFKTKENQDGIYTYKQPFKTISEYLKKFC